MICGIVDLGSNTIRLSIYQYEGQQVTLLLKQKHMAGLAGHVQDGALSRSGILTACRVLGDYRALLNNLSVQSMYVFATASLRNISNTGEAVEEIQKATGIPVSVLDGVTEAALAFRGATLGGGVSTGLLTDIGGGSSELVAYQQGVITSASSLPLGSLSLYTRCVCDLFPTPEERRAMRTLVEGNLDAVRTPGLQCRELCGLGGTVRAASRLAVDIFDKDPDDRTLSADELEELYQRLARGGKDALRQILHSVPDRVHTILPGLIILRCIVSAYGVERVSVSSTGVREGYLMARVIGAEPDAQCPAT